MWSWCIFTAVETLIRIHRKSSQHGLQETLVENEKTKENKNQSKCFLKIPKTHMGQQIFEHTHTQWGHKISLPS